MAKMDSSQTLSKCGYLYKLGDGPINYSWNQRYIVIERSMLYYYTEPSDRSPRGLLSLSNCAVSSLHPLKDHSFSFSLQLASGKRYHFSHLDQAEAEAWRTFIEMSSDSKVGESLTDAAKVEESSGSDGLERRGSVGELPTEFTAWVDRLQAADAKLSDESWTLLRVKQGLRLEASGYQPVTVNDKKAWSLGAVISLIVVATTFVELSWFLLVPILVLLCWLARKLFAPGKTDYIRAVTVVDASPKDIFDVMMDLSQRPRWDCMVRSCKSLETISGHTDIYSLVLAPPRGGLLAQFLKPRYTVLKRYWMRNEFGVYSIIQRSTAHSYREASHVRMDYFEGVSICPLEPGSCKVTFLLSLDLHSSAFLRTWAARTRGCSFAGLREFVLQQICEVQAEEEEQLTDMREDNLEVVQEDPRTGDSELVKYGGGEIVPLETRLSGYARNKTGGIKCINKQELDSQKGIVLELIAKAGKQLMEGKHVVGISLPVRIFEARSTLERMVDWWATAPVYLMNACLAVRTKQSTPLERFKQVITFGISGLYYGTRQLKPFNPVLGETYQGEFVDGTEIHIEHTSHHPPIAHFYVIGSKRAYIYKGHYEFGGKLRGNSVCGGQAGPNIIEFPNGDEIVFEKPLCSISGLLWGDRVLEFINEMPFRDEKNGLECTIKFASKGGLFSRSSQASDFLSGDILENGRVVATVSGNYLDRLEFDGVTYWELEKSPIYLARRPTVPLPSDCRYRPDLQLLGKGDRQGAET